MTPDFLNPSPSSYSSFSHDIIEQKDQDHHHRHQPHFKFFFSQYNEEGSSSLSPSPTSFDSNLAYRDQDQTSDVVQSHEHHNHQQYLIKYKDITGEINQLRSVKSEMNSGGSVKYWMSSKMRMMQKMSNYPESEKPETNQKRAHQRSALEKLAVHRGRPKQDKTQLALSFVHANNGGLVRVCSDCNTTTTPLWRSGPRGPKSLCNACGIRQRKARRALAEAAAAGAGSTSKGRFKLKAPSGSPSGSKLCFREFAGFGVNERDCSAFSGDVAEAAMLLMQLSCHGFVHS